LDAKGIPDPRRLSSSFAHGKGLLQRHATLEQEMRWNTYWIAAVIAGGVAFAQSAPPTGVESEWDVQKLLESLAAGARRLEPLLDQADPGKWNSAAGAASYTPQWKTAKDQVGYFVGATRKFAQQPEKLSVALETYFRLQAMNTTVLSLADGVRKYSNPAVADQLHSIVGQSAPARERLRQYLVELANQKEQEYQIMDKEAQRCRAMVTKQPRASSLDRSNPRSRD
jgi:hypothetical protein